MKMKSSYTSVPDIMVHMVWIRILGSESKSYDPTPNQDHPLGMQIEIVIKKSSNFFTLTTYPGNDIGTIQVFDTKGRGKIQNRIQIGKPQDNRSKSRTLRLQDKIWDTNENTRKLIFLPQSSTFVFIYVEYEAGP